MDYNNEKIILPLINTLDQKSIGCISKMSLTKVVTYRKKLALNIYADAFVYISPIDIVRLENKIKEFLSGIDSVRIKLAYANNIDVLKSHFEDSWEAVTQSIKRDIPSCIGLIERCNGVLEDETLRIYTSHPITADVFSRKDIMEYIRMRILELCGHDVLVELVSKNIYPEHPENEIDNKVILQAAIVQKPSCIRDSAEKEVGDGFAVLLGKNFKDKTTPIENLSEEISKASIQGVIFGFEFRTIKGDKTVLSVDITDHKSSITAKAFLKNNKDQTIEGRIKKGQWVRIRGDYRYDKYQKEYNILMTDMLLIPQVSRQDHALEKRVELHLHTNMSAMDGVSSAKALVQRAAEWGHAAIAITDHGVVQAYPEAYETGKKHGIKVIYGVEAYMINDCKSMILNSNDMDLEQQFVVLDIETTGLNAKTDRIIEIGAVKIVGRKAVDTFHSMVDPKINIPAEITRLTGINDLMVKGAPHIEEVLLLLKQFWGNAGLVAHNASFDLAFINEQAKIIGIDISNPIVDTLALSRELLRDLKKHNLGAVSQHLGVHLSRHHRALDDAKATADIYIRLLEMLENKGVRRLSDVNIVFQQMSNLNSLENNHATILVKNNIGLKNMYLLISKSNMDYFYRKPRMPKSLLAQHREGLLIGSGCNSGELFRAVVKGASLNELREIALFYDYFEIQPVNNNEHLRSEGRANGIEDLQRFNRTIVDLGDMLNKPVIATGDVHFLDAEDEIFRSILLSVQGLKKTPGQSSLYFKTTTEMLAEFKYLGEQKARQLVIEAPNQLSQTIEHIIPIPEEFYPPKIPGAEQEIAAIAMKEALNIYGEPLPDIVLRRLEKELTSIIDNEFAVLYLVAYKLVKKSLGDGYLVGSRGSVGSSLVATMLKITEVNPLAPHYICPCCKHSDFNIEVSRYACGADLPDKSCPSCQTIYSKNGFDIPFEVFMGFEGDKIPDIDLNFSGEYQHVAHKYTEEIFGKGKVFRAGTISTIADRTAFGFVKKYLEENNKIVNNTEIKRLVEGCTGVKRTTGQHPGGVMVVPQTADIYQFTPIQYPADDRESGTITTHFDYNSISNRLVKLDILGHDDPTVIRMMEDITGIDARSISIEDKKTMDIFSGTHSLGIIPEDINCSVGTFGIPEFGTKFVRQMLLETKPTTFSELVRISGLSHGTDVWLNNAQDLVRDGTAHLSEVISTRDDIMVYLLYKGVAPVTSFNIMETVRKGNRITAEHEREMQKKGVPSWFIDSCKKIKYMFPKAHAVAYVIMAFRIAYFKVYYPMAFYAAYFTVRADDFDENIILGDRYGIAQKIKDLDSKGNEIAKKEKNVLTVLEVALEMYCRGIAMLPVELNKSDATKFTITEQGIRPPLNALPGVGINAAGSIAIAQKEKPFISVEDLIKRGKTTKNVVEILKKYGCLDGVPQTRQICLF